MGFPGFFAWNYFSKKKPGGEGKPFIRNAFSEENSEPGTHQASMLLLKTQRRAIEVALGFGL